MTMDALRRGFVSGIPIYLPDGDLESKDRHLITDIFSLEDMYTALETIAIATRTKEAGASSRTKIAAIGTRVKEAAIATRVVTAAI